MSYYQFINSIRYARHLLDAARQYTQGRGEYSISLEEMQIIYKLAEDGRRITDTERRTLLYIAENFTLTNKARTWLIAQLQSPSTGGLDGILNRIVRQEYGLKTLAWQIDPAEVQRQESQLPTRLFESALRGALTAFWFYNRGQLSLDYLVYSRNRRKTDHSGSTENVQTYLEQGTLYLVPQSAEARQALPFDVPEERIDTAANWVFALRIPALAPALFLAHAPRGGYNDYSEGYLSRRPALDTLAAGVIQHLLGYDTLQWQIDPAEVERQLAAQAEQNFGNALFAALNGGIFNAESSFSFWDFIRNEIWQDPELEIDFYMEQYIRTGKLYLIPLDYRNQMDFPLPPDLDLANNYFWYFGLEMPEKTNARFLIHVPRDSNDGVTGWNDGFYPPDERPLQVQLQEVLKNEFDLTNVALTFLSEEFEAQRLQFGPDWKHPQALLRQAINSVLNDYLEPRSIFNKVAEKHQAEIPPAPSENPLEYRAAIREKVRNYLKTSTIELLSIELPDNNPVDGEPIETYWQFFVYMPELNRVGFWVIIPRFPDDAQHPYVYGGE